MVYCFVDSGTIVENCTFSEGPPTVIAIVSSAVMWPENQTQHFFWIRKREIGG